MGQATDHAIDVLMPDAPAGPEETQRTAFYLHSQGRPLLAWLHAPAHTARTGEGAVICPPLGYEQIHAHRTLRHLAEALARAGVPVLRFDYEGTGDSAGVDEDPSRCATWLANVGDAVDWMRCRVGCEQLTLIGVRLGGLLAAQAAAEVEVDRLVLWAPVIKGRAYVREMKALGLTAAHQVEPAVSGDIEAAGFVLTPQTVDDLSRLDLLTMHPRCRRVLIVNRDDRPADSRLLNHFMSQGIATEQTAQPGYAGMMAEPHDGQIPYEAIDAITDWLVADMPEKETLPIEVSGLHTEALMTEDIDGKDVFPVHERIFWIGPERQLFGILSEPDNGVSADRPTVVLLNAGSSYRVGPNRLNVLLARHLARNGFRSLRLDLGGLGDSAVPVCGRENDPYAATAFGDIKLALKSLQSHRGVQRVVLMGLCSGAYFAFQMAVQSNDAALVESVLINPLTFFWKDGMSLAVTPSARPEFFHYFACAARSPKKWLKMLSGQSKIGILGALRLLLSRCRPRRSAGRCVAPNGREYAHAAGLSHPHEDNLPTELQRASAAGRHLAFVFATTDPGYSILLYHARQQIRRLRRAGKVEFSFIDGADHTFSARSARQILLDSITQHLARRYQ